MTLEPIWENEDKGIDWEKEYWDEHDWERLFAQQDRKVDQLCRLSELFRQSGMDPCDGVLISDLRAGSEEPACDGQCPDCTRRSSCAEYQDRLAEESRQATGAPDPEPPDDDYEIERTPAGRACSDFAVETMRWFGEIPDRLWENEPAVDLLAANCGLAGAKIAGASAFALTASSIGGNIANCKRGQAAMEYCVEALAVLAEIPETQAKAQELKPVAEECLRMIHERIDYLRAHARTLWGLG